MLSNELQLWLVSCCFALILSVAITYTSVRGWKTLQRVTAAMLLAYAVAQLLFMAFLWLNHAAFPLNLEAMELTVLQHVRRALAGQPIYVEPSPDFVALAYNPLYYYLAVPSAWIFGVNLLSLRLVAILGMFGSGLVIFLAVRKETNSLWYALIAVGLFAAAYRVMETYLDNAFPDSWMLFTILLGCYLISLNRSRCVNLIGVLLTVIAFWVKQPGALFTVGVVLFLTWREGWRGSWPYWLLAAVLGPVLYCAAPSWLFGPSFRFFTFEVPRQWTDLSLSHVISVFLFLARSYLMLALLGIGAAAFSLRRDRYGGSVWFFLLPFAFLSGLPGLLDPNSANNLYIPLGVWFIITGVIGLKQLLESHRIVGQWSIHLSALLASFALLVYNPLPAIVSAQANTTYQGMVDYLNSIDGPVYAPWIGQLQDGYQFWPAAHWVPMVDLIRQSGVDWQSAQLIRNLLEPVIEPNDNAYVLMNHPLETDPALAFLTEYYVLDTDLGERFAPLATLPKKYSLGYPRYLYRFALQKAHTHISGNHEWAKGGLRQVRSRWSEERDS